MSAIGTTLGAPVGGALIGWFGWRVIFLVNIPLGLAAVALVYLSIPADRLLPAPPTALFDTAMFRERQLLSSLTMSVLVSAVVMTTLVVGPFYLDRVLQLDPAHIGLVMSAGPMVAALSGVPSGRIVDRIGAARATAAGLIVAALGCVALSALPAALGVPGYIIPIGFVTSGYALFQASNATALIMLTPPARRGAVSGLLALSRNAGLITGTWAMGAVFALASTSAAGVAATSAAAAAAGMRSTFAVSAILIILALAIAASAGKPHDKSFLVNP
jgi:predicted MFS family arabinose efflux permease